MLALFASSLALALTFQVDTKALDAHFKAYVDSKRTPSVSVLIVKDGKEIYKKAFGYADLTNDVRATPETVYKIASITKQFTATLVVQLVNEGKLKLTDTLGQYLPEAPESWKAVTVQQLLNHTGGIPNFTEPKSFLELNALRSTTPIGILDLVNKQPLDFAPGTKWSYSDTGYVILGIIVERVDKRTFAESLSDRILKPLGMSNTHFTSERTIVKKLANGYSQGQEGTFLNCTFINMDWPYAAGSMESTTGDMAKWDAALYSDKVLPQSRLKQMFTPAVLADGTVTHYGFGWAIGKVNGVEVIWHNGGINGFTSEIFRVPSKHLTCITLSNVDGDYFLKDAGHGAVEIVEPSLKDGSK